MKQFISVKDVDNPQELIAEAIALKHPHQLPQIGARKTIGLVFFNASLRTRLSTQKAAQNLGMQVMVVNVSGDSWALEFEDGAVMNSTSTEHIKDAAAVIGLYCDILAVRCFPSLTNKEADYSEQILQQFIRYSKVPLLNMESATLHPLQSLADMITLAEHQKSKKPKVVLTWAPHVKALPQVVANSFAQWALACSYDLTITHPEGYALCEEFTQGAIIEYDQEKALAEADFVYVKNWSSYSDYGKVLEVKEDWMLNAEKMKVTHDAKIMHCLPVRRNVELPDELIDGNNSLILAQAENRVYAAQAVLKRIIEHNR